MTLTSGLTGKFTIKNITEALAAIEQRCACIATEVERIRALPPSYQIQCVDYLMERLEREIVFAVLRSGPVQRLMEAYADAGKFPAHYVLTGEHARVEEWRDEPGQPFHQIVTLKPDEYSLVR